MEKNERRMLEGWWRTGTVCVFAGDGVDTRVWAFVSVTVESKCSVCPVGRAAVVGLGLILLHAAGLTALALK